MGSYQPPIYDRNPSLGVADQTQLNGMATVNDLEASEKTTKTARRNTRWDRRLDRAGACCGVLLLLLFILLIIACLAAICFGIAVGVEKGLTGEPFWTRGHSELFRICESPSTTSSTVAVHTCNVYRPRQDLNAPPIHAFTENIRSWLRSGTYLSGSATRVRAVTLESMLLERGLRCTPSSSNGQFRPTGRAQIIIGGVGQSYGYRRRAKACNFDENGRNIQGHCGEYGDGGVRAVAKSHPLAINQIFQKHFGMTCTWV